MIIVVVVVAVTTTAIVVGVSEWEEGRKEGGNEYKEGGMSEWM